MSSAAARIWRSAFLTLRDETSTSPPPAHTVTRLLNQLISAQSHSLIAAAAPDLPPHEVLSDLMLLMELARNISQSEIEDDRTQPFIQLSHLIHGISHSSFLEMNSMAYAISLDSFRSIVQSFLGKANRMSVLIENIAAIKATKQCLESLRCLFILHQKAALLSENEQLLAFVLQVVGYFEWESIYSSYLNDNHTVCGEVFQVLRIAFAMIGEIYSRVGSSLSVDIWQSTLEAFRKFMDMVASKSILLEDNIIAMFYIELLQCLHLVLAEPRGYLADHVAGFVAALRIFFRYGLVHNKSHFINQATDHKKEVASTSQSSHVEVSNRSRTGPYRPPHLREKIVVNQQRKIEESLVSPKHEFLSSDSDCSDNDGSVRDNCGIQFSKARLAAVLCIQDLCRADPKLFTVQWTMLLPSNDVVQHRKCETTLLSSLLFDPSLKVRIAAGCTIMAMLDGPAPVSLQVAEFRGHSRYGSFTSFSSSLGHILMQLHSGVLYLIKHEANSRLLALSFKTLMLLISSTPYSRMPAELLSRVVSSVQSTINVGFPSQSDRNGLLIAAINCITAALSVTPSSTCVNKMLLEEIATGSFEGQQRSGVLHTLFRYSEQLSIPSVSLEAFQALKTVAHNYPHVMDGCWEQVSSIIYEVLSTFSDEPMRLWRGNVEQTATPLKERLMAAAIKALDECLRAISGFKGTEDLSYDKFHDSPFTADHVKTKAISSAPSYSLESPASTKDESKTCLLVIERWCEAATKHMPIAIKHSSAMVRAATVTCFAGMTTSVFYSLPMDEQEFIIISSTNAALNDQVPSVRAAACRAIGVIACFPEIYHRPEVLEKFVHAAKHNAFDSLVSVRISASWAIANICNSLSHCLDALHAGKGSIESRKSSEFIPLLVYSNLRLARDNDKVKANAVRALGSLSRSIQFTCQPPLSDEPADFLDFKTESNSTKEPKLDMTARSDSFPPTYSGSFDWLGSMVQAFLSCVTTGNVKVQWNVCHALSNLFFNKTLKLQDMDWASSVFSVLLLLLRDSSNFKIRIQAAAALAVPETINDYGKSYYDVVKSVVNVVENFKSDQISDPCNFKYWIALEKQLTSTLLHLAGLVARCEHKDTQDFLVKKASFLEGWIKELCSSLGIKTQSIGEMNDVVVSTEQKKGVVLRTIKSLIEVYESSNQRLIAQRFDRLASSLL